MVRSAQRALLVAAFAVVYVLWGSTYLAVALGLRSVPPFLLGLSWLRTANLPPAGAWPHAALSGLLLFAGCHGTLAYAQQRVPSGLAAVLLATIPFWIALLSLFVPADGQRARGPGAWRQWSRVSLAWRSLHGAAPAAAGLRSSR